MPKTKPPAKRASKRKAVKLAAPTKSQQRAINAMARGRRLWLYNARGTGRLTGCGQRSTFVPARDMTDLLYHVGAIENDFDNPLIDGDYRLTTHGQSLAKRKDQSHAR